MQLFFIKMLKNIFIYIRLSFRRSTLNDEIHKINISGYFFSYSVLHVIRMKVNLTKYPRSIPSTTSQARIFRENDKVNTH